MNGRLPLMHLERDVRRRATRSQRLAALCLNVLVAASAVSWREALRPLLVLALLFSSGFAYAVGGKGVPFTSALFTAQVTSGGNTFSTPASYTVGGLSATGVAGGVRLDWTDLSWETGYNVYRGTTADNIPGTALNASPLAAGTVQYTDTGAVPGTTYFYVVRALNPRGIVAPAPTAVSAQVSSDTVQPTVSSLSPASGTVNVGTDARLSIAFSEPMNTATTLAAVTLQSCTDNTSACTTPGAALPFGSTTWTNATATLELTASGALTASTYHKVSVAVTAQDVAGNALAAAASSIFRTASGADTVAPQVVPPTYPADGQVGVPLNASIVIPFSEAMQQSETQAAVSIVCTTGQTGCTDPPSAGYAFSWNAAGTALTVTPGALSASKNYTLSITGRAKDLAGNRLAGVTSDATVAFTSNLFTTGTTSDTEPPLVVPPTTPSDGSTAVPTNSSIVIRFSEAMRQAATQSAITVTCNTGQTGCSNPTGLTYSWNSSSNTVTITHAGLTASKLYTVTVGATASDLAGNEMGSAATSGFATGTGADSVTPTAPTVLSPNVAAWTTASTYTISGTTPENTLLLKIWRDADGNGTFNADVDPLVTSIQLYGQLTNFSVQAPLATGVRNDFLVTVSDTAGNQSAAVVVPPIYQGERATTTGTISVIPGNVSAAVSAPYSGDLSVAGNTTNSAIVEWDTTGAFAATTCVSGAAGKCTMTRGSDAFAYTISGLTQNTTYHVRVTYTDADGVSGTNPQSTTTLTLGGSQTGLVSGFSASRERIANRAPQTTTFSFTLGGSVQRYQLEIKNSSNTTVRDFGCVVHSGTNPVTVLWDGKKANGNALPDGVYTAVVTAAAAANCTSNSEQAVGGSVTISNVASIGMVPAPASITLGQNESVVLTATVRNHRNELVADDVPIQWLRQGSSTDSGSAMASAVSYTGQNNTSASCTVAAGSGQTCNRLSVTTAITQTITVLAYVDSQSSSDAGDPPTVVVVTGATTVNDPPDPPKGLQLSLGSVRVKWDASDDPRVAGYRVYLGTASRRYDTAVDVGAASEYRFTDVQPGTRYYVTVRSYDKNGQLSPLGEEGVIVTPAATPTPSPTATVLPTVTVTATAAATATLTATPTGTAAATVSVTTTPAPGGASTSATATATGAAGGSATPTQPPGVSATATATGQSVAGIATTTRTPSPAVSATATGAAAAPNSSSTPPAGAATSTGTSVPVAPSSTPAPSPQPSAVPPTATSAPQPTAAPSAAPTSAPTAVPTAVPPTAIPSTAVPPTTVPATRTP